MTDRRRITVTGRVERELTPDRARWTFEVVGTGSDEGAALEACVERTGAVLVALREAFGADAHVVTGPTSLVEGYEEEDFEEGPSARASVIATLPAELAGRAAPIGVRAGASGAHGPHWDRADAEEQREALLTDAFAVARRKGERLAAAAGARLGAVVAMREQRPGDGDVFDDAEVVPMGYAITAAAPAPTASPGTVVVAEVVVTFALDDVA
jgi:hypothetical protein